MNPLAHVLAGALIGQVAPGPLSALAGGVLSHYVLDAIPHVDSGNSARIDNRNGGAGQGSAYANARPRLSWPLVEAGAEAALGVGLLVLLVRTCPAATVRPIALGVAGALAPDLIDQPLNMLFGITVVHPRRLHSQLPVRHAAWGLAAQAAIIIAAAWGLWRTAGCATP